MLVAPEGEGGSGSLESRLSGGVCSGCGVGDDPVAATACGGGSGSATGGDESDEVVEVDMVMKALTDGQFLPASERLSS